MSQIPYKDLNPGFGLVVEPWPPKQHRSAERKTSGLKKETMSASKSLSDAEAPGNVLVGVSHPDPANGAICPEHGWPK